MTRVDAGELLDERDQPLEDVEASLRDVQRVNRFLSGISVTRGHLLRLIRRSSAGPSVGSPFTVLDLATGSGDIPRAILNRTRKEGCRLRYVCLDLHPSILEVARRQSEGYPEMEFVRGDARAVPFAERSFDYVTCSLALHHFGPEDAVRILKEMDRVSRRGLVVNDLRRSRVAWALIWLLTRVFRANRLTRHDGPVSTLRAYTPGELKALAERAGLADAKVRRHAFYRMALTLEKGAVEREGRGCG
ncbi:MAG: methyltransferase domain-containing protein [Armatimonadetes bacterium]|nr:methyltransferase domain-containing protein [Armatimonadota bacterium]